MARRTSRKGRNSEARVGGSRTEEAAVAGIWDRIPGSWQHVLCLGVLAVISLSFFAAMHFGGKSLAPNDIVNWRASAESVIEYEEETGEYALWANNVFGGMPAFMIRYQVAIPQVDTLLGLARRVLWPSSHLIALLAGMYLLVVYLTRNKLAGVVSAILFGLTTYIPVILVAGHNSKFIALCLAPWLLLSFAHALRRSGLLAALLFAVALSVSLRAGHFQITYYILFACGVWWVGEAVAAFRSQRFPDFVRTTALLVLGGFIAGLMVAQPYLAQFEYKAFTVRGSGPGGSAGGMAWDYAMGWSQGIGELLTVVIADAFGGSETYWGPKVFTAGPHYFTGLAVFLAAVGALRTRNTTSVALGVAAVLMTLFALGDNLGVLNRLMFDYFPLFDAFRVPETWMAAVALVVAVLAGLGIDSLVRHPLGSSPGKTALVRGFVGSVLLLLVLLVAHNSLFDFEKEGEGAAIAEQIARANGVPATDPRVGQASAQVLSELRAERSDKFSTDTMRTLVFFLLAGGAFALFLRGRLSRDTMQAAVALLVLIDLWTVDRRYLNEARMVTTSDIESAIPEYPFDRFILDQRTDTGRFRVLSLEGAPTQTGRPSYFHESLSGYHGAKLRNYQDFLDNVLVTSAGRLNTRALSMLNTRFIVSGSPVPGGDEVFRDARTGFNVYELKDSLPRAYFVDSTAVVPTPEQAWDILDSPAFNPRTTALVGRDLALPVARRDSASGVRVAVMSYSPRRISLEATTDQTRLLVLSEVYYPAGWRATIDDAPAEILAVNYLLRGVVVPSGSHEIQFEFLPAGHRIGVWLSGVSTALVYGAIVVLIVVGWRRRSAAPLDAEATAPEQERRS